MRAADKIKQALKEAGYKSNALLVTAVKRAIEDKDNMLLKCLLDKQLPSLKAVDATVDANINGQFTLSNALDAIENTTITQLAAPIIDA